jgi:TetR/AcrR family transcriptional regulator, tetracycline repressor protein
MDRRSSQTAFDTGTVFKQAGSRLAREAEVWMAAKPEGIATDDADPAGSHAGPQVAPPPWQRLPDRRARRRREPISREAIVAAAVQLLDREGLAALSMRRLAEELGTGAASLYWHVGSKDGLLDLVLDHLIGEGQVPDPDPRHWQEQLKDVARAQRATTLRHPYIVRISIGRIPMGPNALRYTERVLAILRAGGLPPRLAVQGYLLLIAAVNGFTVDETGVEDSADENPGGEGGLTDAARLQEAANMARDYIASLPAEHFPTMVSLADEFAFADRDERFEMLIDIFVDGLARRAAAAAQ